MDDKKKTAKFIKNLNLGKKESKRIRIISLPAGNYLPTINVLRKYKRSTSSAVLTLLVVFSQPDFS